MSGVGLVARGYAERPLESGKRKKHLALDVFLKRLKCDRNLPDGVVLRAARTERGAKLLVEIAQEDERNTIPFRHSTSFL